MKYNNDYQIRKESQSHQQQMVTDMLVISRVVEENHRKLEIRRPRKKRTIDYAKKIQNDDFIFIA